MNSLERVSAAVNFRQTDRVPVIAQVFGHAATLSGVPVSDYVRDGGTLAKCQLQALKRYGYDAVFSVMDVSVETEAAGSVLRYPKTIIPWSRNTHSPPTATGTAFPSRTRIKTAGCRKC